MADEADQAQFIEARDLALALRHRHTTLARPAAATAATKTCPRGGSSATGTAWTTSNASRQRGNGEVAMWIDWLLYASVALLTIGCLLHILAAMSDDLDALERMAQAPYDQDEDDEVRR